MKTLVSSLLATGASAFIVLAVFGFPNIGPGVDRGTVTGSVESSPATTSYLLESAARNCTVRRGARIKPTVYRLELAADCDPIFDELGEASYWTETPNGGIVFSGGKGTVLEFAQSDGAQFESVLPARPLYSLTPGG